MACSLSAVSLCLIPPNDFDRSDSESPLFNLTVCDAMKTMPPEDLINSLGDCNFLRLVVGQYGLYSQGLDCWKEVSQSVRPPVRQVLSWERG